MSQIELYREWNPDKSSRNQEEFISGSSEPPTGLGRRDFLRLASSMLALAGLAGCSRRPIEKIIPYIDTPEGVRPGHPQYFASGLTIAGYAHGLLIETQDGHPVKIDGNPLHPSTIGRATSIHQSLLLSLYDENRISKITKAQEVKTWLDFRREIADLCETDGTGILILSEISSSPSLREQMTQLQKKMPKLKWIQFEPISDDRVLASCLKVFQQNCSPVYNFKEADVVISFDADIFGAPIYPIRYAADFFERKKLRAPAELFVFEPSPSITGASATQRKAVAASESAELCENLYRRLRGEKRSDDPLTEKINASVHAHPDSCIFIAGSEQPEYVHEMVHHLNAKFGKKTVSYKASAARESALAALENVVAGEAVFVIGSNPVYQLGEKFKQILSRAKKSFRFSLTRDETSSFCQWQLPLAHDFEVWSDGEAFDSTLSIFQPVIRPLFDGKSIHEIISCFTEEKTSHQILKEYWQAKLDWDEAVQKGVAKKGEIFKLTPKAPPPIRKWERQAGYEVIFRADSQIWDGRYFFNKWLQEIPKAITQITWGNVILISPQAARERQIRPGQLLEIKIADKMIKGAAWVLPGQEAKTLTLILGYGRVADFKVAGYNAYTLWSGSPWLSAEMKVLPDFENVASTQTHQTMQGHDFIRMSSEMKGRRPEIRSLYEQEPFVQDKIAWAMVIDLDSCIGCQACISACQSENNIPVVGREAVLNGREMHWIRVDRYFSGDEKSPRIFFQPVPCMHCEKAPCEEVCPVAATVHSTDGLNQMIYNRCVGTRYCANNCPYKVRRFNFFNFNSTQPKLDRLLKNPEVSVRPRGVMEKCTYCVQRIDEARIQSEKENRKIADGEVKTACQVTCPTNAIQFGDQNDPESVVAKLKKSPRNYGLLEELGTRPRTSYLAKVDT